ncbi:hypothetical protein AOC06_03960 [Polynucleobacter paludilacus]|uniref:hypothetical protein n=1 Tax=Polynucleobacter paludilacus TaxID=1855895 RepID=UPI001BFD4E69|nr:hypothetical protein [Polynucleobacter paludilacus]QWD87731.1 hypothetical protein AOC06_03960 [Polynucleobacter paludilacus]
MINWKIRYAKIIKENPELCNSDPSTQTIAESTHVAAMIYYRKTLFGSGSKLTAVHHYKKNQGVNLVHIPYFHIEYPDLNTREWTVAV